MSEVLPKCTNSFYCEFGFFWIFFHALQYFTLCSLYVSGTSERGTPSEQLKGSLKSHQKIKLEGKPWAPHPQRPSPPGPPPRLRASRRRSRYPDVNFTSREARHGRPRQGVHSLYRARPLAACLGKESDLCLTRGLILHVARARLVRSPSPPASTDPPDSVSCLINTSTTPAISAGRWLNATEWPTGPEVASAPYQPGQGTAGITGHCVLTLCPRSAPYRLGQGTAGITGHCVLTLCP